MKVIPNENTAECRPVRIVKTNDDKQMKNTSSSGVVKLVEILNGEHAGKIAVVMSGSFQRLALPGGDKHIVLLKEVLTFATLEEGETPEQTY